MELSFDRRLGIVGVILALAGIGITIIWPDEKLVGWSFLALGALCLAIWLIAEVLTKFGHSWPAYTASAFITIVIFGPLGVTFWRGFHDQGALESQVRNQLKFSVSLPPNADIRTSDFTMTNDSSRDISEVIFECAEKLVVWNDGESGGAFALDYQDENEQLSPFSYVQMRRRVVHGGKLTHYPTWLFVDYGPIFQYSVNLARCCAWALCAFPLAAV